MKLFHALISWRGNHWQLWRRNTIRKNHRQSYLQVRKQLFWEHINISENEIKPRNFREKKTLFWQPMICTCWHAAAFIILLYFDPLGFCTYLNTFITACQKIYVILLKSLWLITVFADILLREGETRWKPQSSNMCVSNIYKCIKLKSFVSGTQLFEVHDFKTTSPAVLNV